MEPSREHRPGESARTPPERPAPPDPGEAERPPLPPLPWDAAPDWHAQCRDREAFTEWRDSLVTNPSSAYVDGYGCLLLLCSLGTLIGGAYLTYLALASTDAGVRGTPGNALCLAVPSILASIGVFYLLAPAFYRLRKRSRKAGE